LRPIDGLGCGGRQVFHRPGVASGAGDGNGDAKICFAARILRIIDITSFITEQGIKSPVKVCHCFEMNGSTSFAKENMGLEPGKKDGQC